MNFPPVPKNLKCLNHFINIASEHQLKNIVASFWLLKYAVFIAKQVVPENHPPEVSNLVLSITSWLEYVQKNHRCKEGLTNQTVAYNEVKKYGLGLINYSRTEEDRDRYHKTMIKGYYHGVFIIDSLKLFGPLTEELEEKCKFAKWRALQIHNCLKVGECPIHPDTLIHFTKEDEMLNGFTENAELADLDIFDITLPNTHTSDSDNSSGLETSRVSSNSGISNELRKEKTLAQESLKIKMTDAEKYCKWAYSALSFEDIKTAVENIQKAIELLQNMD